MDKCVGKRAVRGDSRLKYCSRVSSTGGFHNGTPEKPEQLRASLRFMGGKAIAGSSSKPFSLSGSCRKSFREPQKQMLLQEPDALSTCRQKNDDIESDIELLPVDNVYDRQGIQQVSVSMPKTINNVRSSFSKGISTDITKLPSNSSIASSSKAHKHISRQLVSGKQEASSSSFMPRSTFVSRNTAPGGAPRCGLNNLSCTTILDCFPPGHSCSESVGARSIVMGRKKSSNGDSSASSSRGSSTARGTSVQNAPIRHPVMLEPVLERNRNRTTIRDGAASVRTRRTCQPSSVGRCTSLPPSESILMPQLHQQARVSFPEAAYESSLGAFAVDLPHVLNNTCGQSNSSDLVIRTRTTFCPEDSHAHASHASLGDPQSYRHINVERVAEVLLALEQIEQDEELTYEHLLVLESNLLRSSLRLHDQHRDMRMDVDNMSYEELLALEEKMGTVSTALTDDQLSKCLERTTYTIVVSGMNSHVDDDVKCSICQEEYVDGDEVGRLQCEHRYHVACIHQWLRQKNWCPVCKSCALPS